jgi:hypothetical protein
VKSLFFRPRTAMAYLGNWRYFSKLWSTKSERGGRRRLSDGSRS